SPVPDRLEETFQVYLDTRYLARLAETAPTLPRAPGKRRRARNLPDRSLWPDTAFASKAPETPASLPFKRTYAAAVRMLNGEICTAKVLWQLISERLSVLPLDAAALDVLAQVTPYWGADDLDDGDMLLEFVLFVPADADATAQERVRGYVVDVV